MQSVLNLLIREAARKQFGIQVISVKGPYIPESRNGIAKKFLETDSEWLLSVDNDMIFQPNLLEVLMDVAGSDKKIVGGFYLTYYENNTPGSTWLVEVDGKLFTVGKVENDMTVAVNAVGMGGTLIHRSVFEAVRDAYQDNDEWPWYAHDLTNGKRMGEDVTFCYRASQCGFKTYGTTKASLGHLKTKCLDLSEVLTPKNCIT